MASSDAKKNRVILGLMNFGPDVEWGARITTVPEFEKFLDVFQENGYNEVDTARSYQNGQQEAFTAAARWKERGLKVATKVYPITAGAHSPETITSMFNESLKQLQTDCVDIFYLHAPDRSVPYTLTLQAVNTLFQEGKFKQFGLSNFTVFEVAEIVVTCKERGWVRPTIYQALYNAISRTIEPELIAACRRYGLDIVVYNPLAGGLFTGNYKAPTDKDTTTTINDPPLGSTQIGTITAKTSVGQIYRRLYFKDAYFEALSLITPVIQSHNLTHAEVGLRWLVHHSKLNIKDGNDGVIIGASSVKQLQSNLNDIQQKGPLPKEVLDVLDEAWEITRFDAANYWHSDLKYTYGFDD